MFQVRSINKVFKEDSLPLELVKGAGYFYYIFDMCDAHNVYETETEYVYRLSDMTKDEWIRRGRVFAIEMMHKYGINASLGY
jgi:hypothetical protein